METKRNLKYFTTYGIHPATIVSLVLMLAGAVMAYIFFGTDYIPVAFVGIGLIVVGIVIFNIINGGKSSPDDIDYQIYDRIKYLEETAQKRHEVYESHFSKVIKPIKLQGYDYYTKENLYFKKGSDNKNRTNIYNTAVLYFTKDRMYIYGKHFSLTDELFDKEIMSKHKFVDLDRAEIVDDELTFPRGKYVSRVKTHTFRVIKNDGEVVLSMTVDYGADIDKAAEDINRVISVAKDEAAAKAAAEAK